MNDIVFKLFRRRVGVDEIYSVGLLVRIRIFVVLVDSIGFFFKGCVMLFVFRGCGKVFVFYVFFCVFRARF